MKIAHQTVTLCLTHITNMNFATTLFKVHSFSKTTVFLNTEFLIDFYYYTYQIYLTFCPQIIKCIKMVRDI
jgi:hypothetical protein